MTWEFGANDPATVEKWTEATVRDASKLMTFAPFLTGKGEGVLKNPEKGNIDGIIRVHTDFAGKDTAGKTLTIHNVADIAASEQGVSGDALLRDTGADLDVYTMQLSYDAIAEQVRSAGEMNEKATVLKFRQTAREKLARWIAYKMEGAVVLSLWGLTSYVNGTKLKYWPQDGNVSSVFGNAIQTFDSDHIFYCGDATADANVDSSDILSLDALTRLETKALEDLDIPLEPVMVDGQPELFLFVPFRGKEQLLDDTDFKDMADKDVRGSSNPIVRRSIGKVGMIRVIPIPFALNSYANVAQSMLVGKDALQVAQVEDFSWFEDFEDNRKRRKVISVGGMFGARATKINDTRRNALAVRHYVRS